jgi:hypothetical protein
MMHPNDVQACSDARLRELLEEISHLRSVIIAEIRQRISGPDGYNMHNLDFLCEDDRKQILE